MRFWTFTNRLGPELDVFDSNSDQLVLIKRTPFYHKQLILVTPCYSQFLTLLPVPNHNGVVIVQPYCG